MISASAKAAVVADVLEGKPLTQAHIDILSIIQFDYSRLSKMNVYFDMGSGAEGLKWYEDINKSVDATMYEDGIEKPGFMGNARRSKA